jgi:hypothetical protein
MSSKGYPSGMGLDAGVGKEKIVALPSRASRETNSGEVDGEVKEKESKEAR